MYKVETGNKIRDRGSWRRCLWKAEKGSKLRETEEVKEDVYGKLKQLGNKIRERKSENVREDVCGK